MITPHHRHSYFKCLPAQPVLTHRRCEILASRAATPKSGHQRQFPLFGLACMSCQHPKLTKTASRHTVILPPGAFSEFFGSTTLSLLGESRWHIKRARQFGCAVSCLVSQIVTWLIPASATRHSLKAILLGWGKPLDMKTARAFSWLRGVFP